MPISSARKSPRHQVKRSSVGPTAGLHVIRKNRKLAFVGGRPNHYFTVMHGIETSSQCVVQFKLLGDLVSRAGGPPPPKKKHELPSPSPKKYQFSILISCTEITNSELSITKTLLLQSAPHFGTQTYKPYSTITMGSDGGHTARRWIIFLSLLYKQYQITQWDMYVILKIRRKTYIYLNGSSFNLVGMEAQ